MEGSVILVVRFVDEKYFVDEDGKISILVEGVIE